jgi:hypothetical protein
MTWKQEQLKYHRQQLKEIRMKIAYLTGLPADYDGRTNILGLTFDKESFRITQQSVNVSPIAPRPVSVAQRLMARLRKPKTPDAE